MFITYEKLVAADACEEQALLFKQLFPEGVQITAELCREYADKFDFDWASQLLPDAQRDEFERAVVFALAEYKHIAGPAWAEYKRIAGPAWAEYKRIAGPACECEPVKGSAGAEYVRITAPAYAEYEQVRALAMAEYVRTKATVFGTLAETVE